MTAEQLAAAEQTIREAAAGLNVAVRSERTPSGHTDFVAVDQHAREMRISPGVVSVMPRGHAHAMLAAFAVGATEIKWRDGSTLMLVIEPPREEQ